MCRDDKDEVCACMDDSCCSLRVKSIIYSIILIVYGIVFLIVGMATQHLSLVAHYEFSSYEIDRFFYILGIVNQSICIVTGTLMLLSIYKEWGLLFIICVIIAAINAIPLIVFIIVAIPFTICCVRYYITELR